jgi:murein DD-endopeptidase MepM/ murein hydrolase activator NlpD
VKHIKITHDGASVNWQLLPALQAGAVTIYVASDIAYSDEIVAGGDCKGEPRTDYERTVHVAPQEATLERYLDICREAFKTKSTVGFSYDDAGIGNLTVKNAKLWDIPEVKVHEFQTWYIANYPGTIVSFLPGGGTPPPPQTPFWVDYPISSTEAPRITSAFNAPTTYGKHEGVDFDSYQNSTGQSTPLLAGQDGVVEYVNTRTGESYGLHIVIRHPWDGNPNRYRTLYAHLSRAEVQVGQTVKRGEPIGLAGRTGADAIHLHFGVYDAVAGLKGYIRCADCSALWPEGVLDPTPLIRYPAAPPAISTAFKGLHMRADGNSTGADFTCLHVAKLNAAKIMSNTSFEELTRLLQEGIKASRIVLRLFVAGDNPALKSSARFFDEQRAWLAEFNAKGGRYVEVHNEPNLPQEGLGYAWINSEGFASWFMDVAFLIRSAFPNLLIGWPGLSPQPNAPEYIASMKARLPYGRIDWIGAHSYWGNAAGVDDMNNGRWYRRLLGLGKPVIITEFSNNQPVNSDKEKGEQYAHYYSTLETGVLGAFAFVSSASDATFDNSRETWVRQGALTDIPLALGTSTNMLLNSSTDITS